MKDAARPGSYSTSSLAPASPTPIDTVEPPSALTDGEHELRLEFDALERTVREREKRAEPRSARRAA